MAVQAQQYPSNAFPPDLRNRSRGNGMEEQQLRTLLGAYGGGVGIGGLQILNGTVLSDHGSDLTCNVSGSRKRSRDEDTFSQQLAALYALQQHQQQMNNRFNLATAADYPVKVVPVPENVASAAAISTGLQLSSDDKRMRQSAMTSTSGRPSASASVSSISLIAQDLASQVYQNNVEIDALIRLQNEKLRSGIEEASKRHCRALLSVLGQQVQRRLKEKDAELELANRRNSELEEKLKQMAAENQIWFNLAKNNDAVVVSLRTSLEQALLQNTPKEGFGDSGVPAVDSAVADDAHSCCFEGGKRSMETAEIGGRTACKACGGGEVSVLLLPCRHLCLCKDCESAVNVCPICHSSKNASLQICLD